MKQFIFYVMCAFWGAFLGMFGINWSTLEFWVYITLLDAATYAVLCYE